MISRETENIESISEVVSAFRAITSGGDKPYVTKEEILQVHEFVVCCHGNIPQLLNSSVQQNSLFYPLPLSPLPLPPPPPLSLPPPPSSRPLFRHYHRSRQTIASGE